MAKSKFRVREKDGSGDLQLIEVETSEEAVEEFCNNNYDLAMCVLDGFEIPKIEVFMPDGQRQIFVCHLDFEPCVIVEML